MLASLAKPVPTMIHVCSGANPWVSMSPVGALLLIFIFMPMVLIPILISSMFVHITYAGMDITYTLCSKGNALLKHDGNDTSVLAVSVIHAILFFHIA